VTEFDDAKSQFKVGVSPETLRKTNLDDLKVGSRINLERAMSGSSRFGGHFVQGHVDTTCIIESVTPDPPNSVIVKFTIPPSNHLDEPFLYIVPKGYITLDGTSLTVIDTNVEKRTFSIMMIPYTREHVTLGLRKPGERVNIEVDVLGKYVERVAKSMLFTGQEDKQVGGILSKMIDQLIDKKLDERMKK
jgi:riboflavin synthase